MKSKMERTMFRVAAMLLCGAGIVMSSAMAQQDVPPPPAGQMQGPPPGGGWGRGPNVDRRVEMLKNQLNLTADQAATVKTALEDERGKMEALRSNTSLSPEDRRSQMMTIRQSTSAKIRAALSPDQQTKFDQIEAAQRQRMQNRGGGGPGGPGGVGPGGD